MKYTPGIENNRNNPLYIYLKNKHMLLIVCDGLRKSSATPVFDMQIFHNFPSQLSKYIFQVGRPTNADNSSMNIEWVGADRTDGRSEGNCQRLSHFH